MLSIVNRHVSFVCFVQDSCRFLMLPHQTPQRNITTDICLQHCNTFALRFVLQACFVFVMQTCISSAHKNAIACERDILKRTFIRKGWILQPLHPFVLLLV